MNKANLAQLLEQHRAEPHVELDQYRRRKRIELAKSLSHRVAVYLDTKFWIVVRDVELGRPRKDAELELANALRAHVAAGRIFCPISEVSFHEILRQEDLRTRSATARLVDQMSCGAALCGFEQRVSTELAHFIYKQIGGRDLYPLDHLVWTSVGCLMTDVAPHSSWLPPSEQLVIQKAFLDHMWTMTLEEQLFELGSEVTPVIHSEAFLQRMNADVAAYAAQNHSFDELYRSELNGGLSLFLKTAVDIVASALKGVGDKNPLSADFGSELARILVAAPRSALAKALPSLHVHTICHAAVRQEQGRRRVTANDLVDFHHASVSIPYCKAFFTDRPLTALLTASNIALDEEYGCTIAFDPADASARLSQLLN